MRTSSSQLELLIKFMEKHGDISRPIEGPNGRKINMQRWSQLANLLNADPSGDNKSENKWRKAWSDIKTNIKKKAAKIKRAAVGTSASNLKLTPFEERVLDLLNPQAPTDISTLLEVDLVESDSAAPAHRDSVFDTSLENGVGISDQHVILSSQTPPAASQPDACTHATRRRKAQLPMGSSLKRRRPSTQSYLARQYSDQKWRAFLKEKSLRDHELEVERLKLREIDLQQQARWQVLFAQFLVVLNNFSEKLSKK